MTVREVDKLSFLQDWAQWHASHEAALADEHGWLAITSVNWLTTEAQRFTDAPGAWLVGDDRVVVVLDRGEIVAEIRPQDMTVPELTEFLISLQHER